MPDGGIASDASSLGASWKTFTALNATFKVVQASAVALYIVEIDATNNTSEDVFVFLYNTATPTVGTTAAKYQFKCPAGQKKTYVIPESGNALNTACAIAAKKEKGTAGSTNPSGTVKVRLSYT